MINNNKKTLIICPPSTKQHAIEVESGDQGFQDVKIMTTSELKENLFFPITKKMLVNICEQTGYNMSLVKKIASFLYYIDTSATYDDEKINQLKDIKAKLENEKIICKNILFYNFLKNVNVSFRYFLIEDADTKWLMSKIPEGVCVNNESITTLEYKQLHAIYEFNTLEEECIYLFNQFSLLIDKGVYPENIVLLNPTDESLFTLDRISKFYNIAIDLPIKTKIAHTLIAKEFIESLKNETVLDAFMCIKNKYAATPQGAKICDKILNIINDYSELEDYDNYKQYIIADLKEATVANNKLDKAIRTDKLSSYTYKDGDYVFIMNANYGVINKIYKDDDYLSDKQKEKIGMPTSVVKNKDEIEFIKKKVQKLNSPFVTYHLNTPFNNAYPSFLNDDLDKKQIIKNPKFNNEKSYSQINDIYELIKKKELKQFDKYYNYLNKYLNTYIEEYDPTFKGLDKDKIYQFYLKKDDGLQLSYTTINKFYQCPFRFYLDKILYLDEFESKFSTTIGNIFHDVLSKMYNDDFNLDEEFESACKNSNYEFKDKELFLLNKLKEELAFDILVIKNHYHEATLLKKQMFEKEIIIPFGKRDDLSLSFEGKIDKTMYSDENDSKCVSIIDYKTGKADINFDDIEHGVGMQLPSYLFLISKSHLFDDYKFAGFYLQPILADELTSKYNKTRDQLRKDYLKLNGYSNSDTSILSKFDNTYTKSEYIKGMAITKEGNFGQYAKTKSSQEMNALVNLVEEKINYALNEILNARFNIKPYINKSDEKEGCKYCAYSDICYKNYNKEVLNDDSEERN